MKGGLCIWCTRYDDRGLGLCTHPQVGCVYKSESGSLILKENTMLTVLLCTVAAIDFKKMSTVSIQRVSFEARTTVHTAFARTLDSNAQGIVAAEMTLNTRIPAIRLANFPHIEKMTCEKGVIELEFSSTQFASEASESWLPGTAVITPFEMACQGPEIAAFMIDRVNQQDSKLAIFSTWMDMQDLVQDWELNVNQYQQTAMNQTIRPSNWNKGAQLPLLDIGINYNKMNRLALNRNMTIFDVRKLNIASLPPVALFCIDCFAYGQASLQVSLKGNFLSIKEYEIKIDGLLKANMDLQALFFTRTSQNVFPERLASVPLSPFEISGLLSFGPECQLNARVATYGTDDMLELGFGFDFEFPFSWAMKSSNGVFSKPEFSASGKPSLDLHPFSHSKNIQARIAPVLTPQFAIAMRIVKVIQFDVSIGLDNSLGLELSTGTFVDCPTRKVEVKLYHEHGIVMGIAGGFANKRLSEKFDLWKTSRLPIACIQCQVCPVPSGLSETVSSLTAVPSLLTSEATPTLSFATPQATSAVNQEATVITPLAASESTISVVAPLSTLSPEKIESTHVSQPTRISESVEPPHYQYATPSNAPVYRYLTPSDESIHGYAVPNRIRKN